MHKRAYEASAKVKLSRLQRKRARFWAPCLCNWTAARKDPEIREANDAAAYAPRFHPNGHIAILQNDVEQFLPCPLEPAKGASQDQQEEFRLALHLRCRLGAVNCRRLGSEQEKETGCSKPMDRKARRQKKEWERRQALPALLQAKHHCFRFGGCVHQRRVRRHNYQCPLQDYASDEFEYDLGDILWQDLVEDIFHGVPGSPSICQIGPTADPTVPNILTPNSSAMPDVALFEAKEKRLFPKPSREVRRFLCNDSCPQQCCTLLCPWNSMRDPYAVKPHDIVKVFGSPCSCNLWTCRICVQERLLRRSSDPHPLSVVSAPGCTLQFPPPARCAMYMGAGDPVSDSSVARYVPKLYKLTCVPWGIKQVGGELPDWLAQTNVLAEFLDSNGWNTRTNYRLGAQRAGGYQAYMQPIHDRYAVVPYPCKVYREARGYWIPEEAHTWNAQALAASGISDESASESGWEWRWQEDMETWTNAEVRLQGQFQKLCGAFSADRDPCREWVKLVDGRVASMRCALCTFIHGPPELQRNVLHNRRAKVISVTHPGIPEEVALGGARLLVQLRAILSSVDAPLGPADVVRMAARFDVVSPALAKFCEDPSLKQALKLLSLFEPDSVASVLTSDQSAPGSASAPEDNLAWEQFIQDRHGDFVDFLIRLRCLGKVFDEDVRSARAPDRWKIYDRAYRRKPYLVEVPRYAGLDHTYTQDLLEHVKFQAPIFALVDGDAALKPRVTRGWAQDCKCNTPWHERSLWERQPWVTYEVPPPQAASRFGCRIAAAAVAEQTAPASGSAALALHEVASCAAGMPDTVSGTQTSCMSSAEGFQGTAKVHHNTDAEVIGKLVVSASGTTTPQEKPTISEKAHEELLTWTSEDETGFSSERGEMQSSDEESVETQVDEERNKEQWNHEGDEETEASASEELEPLDVDPFESGDGCPATPLRRLTEEGDTPEKSHQAPRGRLNAARDRDEEDVCFPAWGDVLGDNSSDDCPSPDAYCNESEER